MCDDEKIRLIEVDFDKGTFDKIWTAFFRNL